MREGFAERVVGREEEVEEKEEEEAVRFEAQVRITRVQCRRVKVRLPDAG